MRKFRNPFLRIGKALHTRVTVRSSRGRNIPYIRTQRNVDYTRTMPSTASYQLTRAPTDEVM